MRLSAKGRYAVTAVVELAGRSRERPVPLADIAARQAISQSYLEQIFARLRCAGLVQSVRGPGGGYVLARPASRLGIAEIVLAAEGSEPEPVAGRRTKRVGAAGATDALWRELGHRIDSFLGSVSVQDVIDGRMPGSGDGRAALLFEPFRGTPDA